jgi:serine/threonine protein kinase
VTYNDTFRACTLQQLPDILAANGMTLSPHHALRIATDMIEGLSYVHQKRLMHRDLKSDNVALELPLDTMLVSSSPIACQTPSSFCAFEAHVSNCTEPRSISPTVPSASEIAQSSLDAAPARMPSACIIDFGMARAFDVVDHDNDFTAQMMDYGEESAVCDDDIDKDDPFPVRAVSARVSIPLYCAPEIALSVGLYDCKADMWAGAQHLLGVPCYRLLQSNFTPSFVTLY